MEASIMISMITEAERHNILSEEELNFNSLNRSYCCIEYFQCDEVNELDMYGWPNHHEDHIKNEKTKNKKKQKMGKHLST